MKDRKEIIEKAIDRIIGQPIEPGTIIGCREDPLTWKFLRYEGEDAVCEGLNNNIRNFPRSSIFDVKKCINVANHYLHLGFWEEGMESMILTVGEPDSSPSDPVPASPPSDANKTAATATGEAKKGVS